MCYYIFFYKSYSIPLASDQINHLKEKIKIASECQSVSINSLWNKFKKKYYFYKISQLNKNTANEIEKELDVVISNCPNKIISNNIKVYFSPSIDCEDNIIQSIKNSKKQIDIAVYSINNTRIVEAIKKSHDKGIKLRIITDRLQSTGKTSKIKELKDYGISVKINKKLRIEHNKFAIFDGTKIVTGSYNWTNAASQHNSENCLFIKNNKKQIVKDYQQQFEQLWEIYK